MAKILVVEDADAVRRAIVAVLATLGGHDVLSAADGGSALEILDQQEIDLAITDIWMPGEDGIAFLRKAKAKRPDLPVIVVTGGGPAFPPIELSLSVVEAHGADAVLIKPFEDADLLAAVARLTRHPS
ncbi:response regulator [Telmatospirillum siberiense]|uniref:Response regulator n=1 Tax=Telmatospirillum siberiense TaxID=382514 RepID=A0A2N3PX58_9PROT|nr:response regulator [Telmatospirillum siberiense]PKU24965.1 response regulator [Telmatospirillum siberiense]